eukprot:SAG31_NODE_3287_length_4459_cov_117.198394_2_plen_633_part_00
MPAAAGGEWTQIVSQGGKSPDRLLQLRGRRRARLACLVVACANVTKSDPIGTSDSQQIIFAACRRRAASDASVRGAVRGEFAGLGNRSNSGLAGGMAAVGRAVARSPVRIKDAHRARQVRKGRHATGHISQSQPLTPGTAEWFAKYGVGYDGNADSDAIGDSTGTVEQRQDLHMEADESSSVKTGRFRFRSPRRRAQKEPSASADRNENGEATAEPMAEPGAASRGRPRRQRGRRQRKGEPDPGQEPQPEPELQPRAETATPDVLTRRKKRRIKRRQTPEELAQAQAAMSEWQALAEAAAARHKRAAISETCERLTADDISVGLSELGFADEAVVFAERNIHGTTVAQLNGPERWEEMFDSLQIPPERREPIMAWLHSPTFRPPPPQPRPVRRRTNVTQATRLRRAWLRADADGSGSLDLTEFTAVLAAVSSSADAATIFEAIDSDGNGTVEYGEFKKWFTEQGEDLQQALAVKAKSRTEDASQNVQIESEENRRVRRAWLRADADGSGSLDLTEFTAVLAAVSSSADAATIFEAIDSDGNGTVEYGEFKKWFTEQGEDLQQALAVKAKSRTEDASQNVQIESEENRRVRRAWLRADADGSGQLDKEELSALLEGAFVTYIHLLPHVVNPSG